MRRRSDLRLQIAGATLLALVSLVSSPADAAPIDDLKQMEARLNEALAAGRFPEAEQIALQMIDVARREAGRLAPDIQPAVKSNLAGVYATWGKFRNAERLSLESIAELEQLHGREHKLLEQPLSNLGIAYFSQERFAEAAAAQRRALALRQRHYGANSPLVASGLENLAVTLDNWGYRAEAEPLYQQAITINLQNFGREHPAVTRNIINLGHMYQRENRNADAEELYRFALKQPAEAVYPRDLINALRKLGEILQYDGRTAEAEECYRAALEMKKQLYGENDPFASLDSGLWSLYLLLDRLDEAEAIAKRELAASEDLYGTDSADYALRLLYLAQVQSKQKRDAEALATMNQCLDVLQKTDRRPNLVCEALAFRGLVAWQVGKFAEAQADFNESMRLSDEMRVFSVGAERERAQAFSQMQRVYTEPGVLYLAAGKMDEGFACLERGRARALIDQMMTARVDLLEGVPAAEAQRLRQADANARADVAGLEKELETLSLRGDLDEAARENEARRIIDELNLARQRAVQAYSALRTASPKFREIVAQGFEPMKLAELEAWLRERDTALLYYASSPLETWVLAIGGKGPPRATRLSATEQQAQTLGIEPGPVAPWTLESTLIHKEGQGVLQLISNPNSGDEPNAKLAALGELLIPEALRASLFEGQSKHVVIVPDGMLAMLPFEALIATSDGESKFLIEAGPALHYAPSATILHTLAERPAAATPEDREPVLALGDPAYGAEANNAQNQTAQRAAYQRLGGQLSRLPYSGQEATWVAEVYKKNGIKAAILKDRLATERMVRGNVAGRRVVHLACHGLCDQTYGNFFGALALAPNADGKVDATDNGLLSLPEMYELDLTSCELAILSACQTNYGERQQGEGVWALTRGFLVAGSRRVVASNWLVDDEAAASIVSYYCSLLAKQESAGQTPDYAAALRDAKRWAREQGKWKHPFYWATFVLIGPS